MIHAVDQAAELYASERNLFDVTPPRALLTWQLLTPTPVPSGSCKVAGDLSRVGRHGIWRCQPAHGTLICGLPVLQWTRWFECTVPPIELPVHFESVVQPTVTLIIRAVESGVAVKSDPELNDNWLFPRSQRRRHDVVDGVSPMVTTRTCTFLIILRCAERILS